MNTVCQEQTPEIGSNTESGPVIHSQVAVILETPDKFYRPV